MEYVSLGRSGVKVSRFCLGTGNFGSLAEEKESHAIMDAAVHAGINFFDTADIYGGNQNEAGGIGGLSEEMIGRWFKAGAGRRDSVVLATKVWGPVWAGPNGRGLSAYHIRRACDDSLRRLQTDHIDLYQMHSYEPGASLDEIWQAMETLIQQGKILYVGSGDWPAWEIVRANSHANRRGLPGLVTEQGIYNLAARGAENELLPMARKLGVGILPWGPLCGGILGGVLRKTQDGRRAKPGVREAVEQRRGQIEAYEALCSDLGHEPSQVALAWLLSQAGVTAPILGPRRVDQLQLALPALELRLDEATLQRLDEIWPRPGTGPGAYRLD